MTPKMFPGNASRVIRSSTKKFINSDYNIKTDVQILGFMEKLLLNI